LEERGKENGKEQIKAETEWTIRKKEKWAK
jgi:hypothetical protein